MPSFGPQWWGVLRGMGVEVGGRGGVCREEEKKEEEERGRRAGAIKRVGITWH